tara:strand:- start:1183 stop:1695 length:513 start_codon:yes stop_codon:yes gene_type:complete
MKKLQLSQLVAALFMLFFVSGTSFSQQPSKKGSKEREERIEQLKISFITKELNLTSKEAQQFWPVYNEMNDKIIHEKKAQRETSQELKKNHDSFSDNDFKSKIASVLESESREVELKSKYIGEIAAIISYKKASKLLSLEQRFKRELLSQLNKRTEPGQKQRQGSGPRRK